MFNTDTVNFKSNNGPNTGLMMQYSVHPEIPENLLWNLLDSIPLNLSIWRDGNVVYANSAFFKIAGVEPGDLKTLTSKASSDDFLIVHPDDFPTDIKGLEIVKEALNDGKLFHKEIRMKGPDEEEFRWYNTYVVRGKEKNSKITIEIDEDISEKKKMVEQLNKVIKEKDILLKEVHHRVKNNFQIISSLLRLQQKKVFDKDTIDILLESENRIKSIAMVHESLYNSADIVNIDFGKYIGALVKNLVESYNGRTRLVKFNIESAKCNVGVDIALPCALIINELVSNSFKHGFDDSPGPEMNIKFLKTSNQYDLIVNDNGVGYPDSFYVKQTDTLGIMLIKTLVKQLGGEVEFKNNPGAEVLIKFNGD